MYYTVIKHDGNLRTREKFRKHEPQARRVFSIFLKFSQITGVFYDSLIFNFHALYKLEDFDWLFCNTR